MEGYYSSRQPLDTPIDWWHQLEGGMIADERPPPPGVGDPYPNLALIPVKPTPTDPAKRRALMARLTAERDRTSRAAAQDPIEPPVNAAPAPSGAPTAPMTARVDAATAPPPPAPTPAAPPDPAPAALQAAASPTAPARHPPSADGKPQPAAPLVAGPAPALPAAPPPIPDLPGIPAATTAPATPKPRPQIEAEFLPASAVMRPATSDALRALAARRGGGTVAVLGGGDAKSAAPDDQALALPLAWRRARAMEGVLTAAGVPASSMRVDAAALARGGIVRLLD